ncbi:MAG TPA: anhydro-N-acetylmuramic acid kinase, partial [Burkholderiaceae bacterium]|nr:anhydro-N-acetylmuramic acid kinase [Burkholderiaceae bacterium]
ELAGIAVIADFRSRDVAAGGQGAPLVPVVHQALFAQAEKPCAVLNLGGMANVTLLDAHQGVSGFDTGPANVLLDIWTQKKLDQPFDRDGAWAAGGSVNRQWLDHLIASEPWLATPPPKSTGRDLFNENWLQARLTHAKEQIGPISDQDIQATLLALTARTASDAIRRHAPDTQEIIVCGGGALNTALLSALRDHVPRDCRVTTSQDYGIPVQQMEALAFAWLAWAWENRIPASLPSVTGARAPRILGGYYPA